MSEILQQYLSQKRKARKKAGITLDLDVWERCGKPDFDVSGLWIDEYDDNNWPSNFTGVLIIDGKKMVGDFGPEQFRYSHGLILSELSRTDLGQWT